MLLSGKGLKPAVYAGIGLPISPCDFKTVFGGDRRRKPEPSITHWGRLSVLKTLELGTEEYGPVVWRETQRNMFLNCVLKPVFRSDPERGFQERMRSLAVRRAQGYGVRRPGGIQGHRSYLAGIPSATSKIGSAADVLPDHTR